VATLSLWFVRPLAVRHLQPPGERFGVEALVGRAAYVVSEVSAQGGRVRIGGEEWTARAYDETLVIAPGTTVDVMEISGSTALVYPRE
ncbi:NfeD family protein, partial [Streptomyces sp. NPDC091259]